MNFPIKIDQGQGRYDIKIPHWFCCEVEFCFTKWKEVQNLDNYAIYIELYDKEDESKKFVWWFPVISWNNPFYPSDFDFWIWEEWNNDRDRWKIYFPFFCNVPKNWADAQLFSYWNPWDCCCYRAYARYTWSEADWWNVWEYILWWYWEICFLDTRKC